jgi:hypothetical protein
MIPYEAMEAATEAFARRAQHPGEKESGSVFEECLRAALEAAAPHMMATQCAPRSWVAKNRHPDGSVSIIGCFRSEAEAKKWADMWPSSFVDPSPQRLN